MIRAVLSLAPVVLALVALAFATPAHATGAEKKQKLMYLSGKLFEHHGRLYISSDPSVINPAYEVRFKHGERPNRICRWNVNHDCPAVTLYFERVLAHPAAPTALINAVVGLRRDSGSRAPASAQTRPAHAKGKN